MSTSVAVVQMPFGVCSAPQEFADLVRAPIERAAANGAQLVLLPHLTSFMLFGMFDVDVAADAGPEQFAERQGIGVDEWLKPRAGYVFEFYLHLFQSLARRHEIWLAPGTVIESVESEMYLTAFLLNPEGEIMGRQRKLRVTERERGWGIVPGDTLRVFETELGDMAFVIGEDTQDAELLAGHAEIVLHPTAFKEKVDAAQGEELAQQMRAFVALANLAGAGYGGGAGIYAPGGVGGESQHAAIKAEPDEMRVVSASLDLGRLRAVRQSM